MIVAEWQTRHWFDTHSWQCVTGACSLQLLSIFKTQHCSKTSDVCRQSKIQRRLQAKRNTTFAHFHSENMKKHKSIHVKSNVKAVSLTSIYVMTALRLLDAPTTHSMRSRVYVTVGRPSVRPSVRPIDRQQQRRPASLLLSAGGVCSRYRPIACTFAAGAQQQMRLASRSESSVRKGGSTVLTVRVRYIIKAPLG